MSNSISQFIDHTALKPDLSPEEVTTLCEEAVQYGFASVCVPPTFVEHAYKLLVEEKPSVSTVIGFPFGYDGLAAKIESVKSAINDGASEFDVVVNIAQVKAGNWDYVKNEVERLATAIHRKNHKLMKLIFETAYLNAEEIKQLCNLCIQNNVDFAKTSTGYAHEGATIQNVQLMKSVLRDKVQIKASGGIKTAEFAQELIDAGASRLGTSSGLKLIGVSN